MFALLPYFRRDDLLPVHGKNALPRQFGSMEAEPAHSSGVEEESPFPSRKITA
ncbi:MAG: hypothetical protein N2487_05230 [Verrucomicrobiae bacterium]|nr:hypothetical protein [Verrucomicrobiae bacterium]